MKVLIVEDERPATQKLIRLLEEVDPTFEIVEVLESVERTTNWLLSHTLPELIFMDFARIEAVLAQFQPRYRERFLIKIAEHYKSIKVSAIKCFQV